MKLKKVPQPKAENLRQNKQVSVSGADMASAKPKDQTHKEIQSAKKALLAGDLGFKYRENIPKYALHIHTKLKITENTIDG